MGQTYGLCEVFCQRVPVQQQLLLVQQYVSVLQEELMKHSVPCIHIVPGTI